MTRVSQFEVAQADLLSQGAVANYDMSEAALNSFEEAWDSGPTAAIGRRLDSFFDTSVKIDPLKANDQFGLAGTEAAFKEGEEVSLDRAKAVSDDFYKTQLHNIVKETVNAESPILGNITQFAASVAAGFTDPVMLAANMGGAALLSAGGRAVVGSKRAFDTVSKISPSAGRLMLGAYEEGARRSLTAVIAREGLENFVGGAIEESVIRGMDVGEERLAIKTDWTDSMLNITAGTILGTGLGVIASPEGRKAVIGKFGRLWGDDAPARIKREFEMSDVESRLGVEKSHFETKLYEDETYGVRSSHGDVNYKFNSEDTAVPSKVYIAVDEAGTAYRPQILGRGTVLHDNLNFAYNKGVKVLEYDTANLRIIGPQDMVDAKGRPTAVMTQLRDTLANDVTTRTDKTLLTKALAAMDDADADIDALEALPTKQLIARVKEKLNGAKDIDDLLNVMDELGVKSQIAYDPIRSVNAVIEKHNWNGYQFTGKKADGTGAYKGIYVAEKFTKKLQKSSELPTPPISEGDKIKRAFELEQKHLEYADWMATKAKSLKQTSAEAAGIPKGTVDDTITPPKSELQEVLASTVEKQESLRAIDAELDARLAANPDDVEVKSLKKFIEEVKAGKTPEQMRADVRKQMEDYSVCMRG